MVRKPKRSKQTAPLKLPRLDSLEVHGLIYPFRIEFVIKKLRIKCTARNENKRREVLSYRVSKSQKVRAKYYLLLLHMGVAIQDARESVINTGNFRWSSIECLVNLPSALYDRGLVYDFTWQEGKLPSDISLIIQRLFVYLENAIFMELSTLRISSLNVDVLLVRQQLSIQGQEDQ